MPYTRFLATILISCLCFPAGALAAEHTWDDGGVQPGTGYPGGRAPEPNEHAVGGATPEQDPPPTPTPPPPPPVPTPTPISGHWRAKILPNGKAWISVRAPLVLRQMISAGNQIVGRPYRWGGGHKDWESPGYDCSGAVSYVLHGGSLMSWPMTSGEMMSWGQAGRGRLVTLYAHKGHVFMHIAGIRLDTSWVDDPSGKHGVRWRPLRSQRRGFRVRHPAGL